LDSRHLIIFLSHGLQTLLRIFIPPILPVELVLQVTVRSNQYNQFVSRSDDSI
jgi:hypothetical protein